MKKLIPLLLLVVAMPSWAKRQFDIEVIIFKRAVNPEQTAESWPNAVPDISMKRVGNLNDTGYRAQKESRCCQRLHTSLTLKFEN